MAVRYSFHIVINFRVFAPTTFINHYLPSHNFWYTVVAIPIYSGCQRHDRSITCWVTTSSVLLWLYLYIQDVRHDRSITCWVTTSGVLLWLYRYNQAVRGMTGELSAESQLLVYCCGIPLHSGCQAWQEHYLLSHNFWYTVVAIPIYSGCQAWQEHYLLSHNFWCTVVAIHIHSGCHAWQEYYLLSYNFWCTVVAIPLH